MNAGRPGFIALREKSSRSTPITFEGEDMRDTNVPSLAELFGPNPPMNWGKWGAEDEIGTLNYLGPEEALKGVAEVKTGESHTLQIQMGWDDERGDPVWPGRPQIERKNVRDAEVWAKGETGLDPYPGDRKSGVEGKRGRLGGRGGR